MTLVTNVYAYTVVLRFESKKTKRTEEHTTKVIAYSVSEAIVQALHQVCAGQDIKLDDYEPKILFVGPDIEEITKTIADTMRKGVK